MWEPTLSPEVVKTAWPWLSGETLPKNVALSQKTTVPVAPFWPLGGLETAIDRLTGSPRFTVVEETGSKSSVVFPV